TTTTLFCRISNSEFFFLSGFTEINVCCVYGSNCTLSCSFRQETDDLYWSYITRTGQVNVHSFYKNRDQLDDQDPRFNGRTSLVEDQVTGRKTALMMKKVKVQDEGTYKCFFRMNNDEYQPIYVVLQVYAPVQTVDMVTSGNSITCSSEGIYPKPELTWSSSPQSSNTVQQTEEKLYNISSSMKLSDMDGDQLNCTVMLRLAQQICSNIRLRCSLLEESMNICTREFLRILYLFLMGSPLKYKMAPSIFLFWIFCHNFGSI
uniref:Ig-like domain-containing protein n=1 Tax=Gouania willdenowi TaxID=441366 RepID=A0A8C5GED2_GOUWI